MITQLSHSLHVSSGEHTISNSKQLRKVANHNSRKFSKSNNTRLDLNKSNHNHTIVGSDNIVSDVKSLYEMTFNDSIAEYNSKQKRNDRKIDNYFNHIDNSKQSNLAEEIIVQFGGAENFEGADWDEYKNLKEVFTAMFESYTNKLSQELPNFKIANATIHFDETTPHLHIIGIPIKEECSRGLSTQISKSSVFTREGMSELQKTMKNHLSEELEYYFEDMEVKETAKGRNENFNTDEIIEYKRQVESLKIELEEQEEILHTIERLKEDVEEQKESYEHLIQGIGFKFSETTNRNLVDFVDFFRYPKTSFEYIRDWKEIYKQYGDEQVKKRGLNNKEKFYELLPWAKNIIKIENEREFNSQKLERSKRSDYDFEM